MRLTILIFLLLAGCASIPNTIHDVKDVKIAVKEKCVEALPVKPQIHTEDEIKAMNDYEAAITLLLEHIMLRSYSAELEAALAGCK